MTRAAPLLAILATLTGCASLPAGEGFLRLSTVAVEGSSGLSALVGPGVAGGGSGCQVTWAGEMPPLSVVLTAGGCEVVSQNIEEE